MNDYCEICLDALGDSKLTPMADLYSEISYMDLCRTCFECELDEYKCRIKINEGKLTNE